MSSILRFISFSTLCRVERQTPSLVCLLCADGSSAIITSLPYPLSSAANEWGLRFETLRKESQQPKLLLDPVRFYPLKKRLDARHQEVEVAKQTHMVDSLHKERFAVRHERCGSLRLLLKVRLNRVF